jgi:hypothetical protein
MMQKWEHKFERKPQRWVFVPTEYYKKRGLEIHKKISKIWTAPSYYYHLNAGGHVAAMHAHKKNKYYLSLDIEDFFGSIGLSRITRNLVPLFGYTEARSMAKDSTVNHPVDIKRMILPYGFTQSPVISSLVLANTALGKGLDLLSRHLKVSVYMDDILLSSDSENILETAKINLIHLAEISKFNLHPEKCQGPAATLTAFNIDIKQWHLEINRNRMTDFVDVLENSPSEYKRDGILGYINSVNPLQASAIIAMGL